MKTNILFLVWFMVLAAPPLGKVLAQAPAAPPVVGHVLLLDNESVLEGEVTRDGDRYIVKRAVGEIKVPVAKVLIVCAGMDEAFKILSSRTNQQDADERVRMARWCQSHGMMETAIAETQAALTLRPNHADAKHLLTILQRTPPPSQQAAAAAEPARASVDAPLLEVSGDCLALFTTKIQPIVMNTCANCHANGRCGAFVLTRSTDTAGRRATQLNLSATLRQICFEQPSGSPLLFKACSAHGGGSQPPLGTNQAVPFDTLKEWVELVVARNPHLHAEGTPLMAGPPPGSREVESGLVSSAPKSTAPVANAVLAVQKDSGFRSVPITTDPTTSGDAKVAPVPSMPSTGSQTAAPKDLPPITATPMTSNDPYDPNIFNQMFHPKQ